jgi:hypothetical protein
MAVPVRQRIAALDRKTRLVAIPIPESVALEILQAQCPEKLPPFIPDHAMCGNQRLVPDRSVRMGQIK